MIKKRLYWIFANPFSWVHIDKISMFYLCQNKVIYYSGDRKLFYRFLDKNNIETHVLKNKHFYLML